jgi:DNA-binding transcriptional MerR regulator
MKNNREDSMLIGEFSKLLGTTPRAIRLYEQMGLVGAPRRSTGGVRYYCEVDIKRFKFVLKLKVLGISLDEMQKLAKIHRLVDSESEKSVASLTELLELLDIHQKNIKQKIASFESFQTDIENFRNNVLVNCVSARCPRGC